MKKVYWSKGIHNDGNGWYTIVEDETCAKLLHDNLISKQNNYYICLNSKRFIEVASQDISSDNPTRVYIDTEANESNVTSSNTSLIYSNPGKTLKGIATAVFIIGCFASLIIGIVVANLSFEFNFAVFAGIFIGGIILSYISGLITAAFGDLVMNVNDIKRKIK